MVKRLILVVALLLAVLTGLAIGQRNAKPPLTAPVFSAGDLGFQTDEPLSEVMKPGRLSVTGKLVINVNGRWIEARPRTGIVPLR